MTDSPADVLGELAPEQVRLRFAPSPTGYLHIGNVRTALFNWAFARHFGGKLILRIEDTDRARNTDDGVGSVIASLRWLGIDYDEGPDLGGPFAPYLQSERSARYLEVAGRLRDSGHAYDCYCSQLELDERREVARKEGRTSGYDGHCRDLTPEQTAGYLAEGRRPVLRLRMPDKPVVFDDLVRGEITFLPEHVPDYVLVRANGDPLYTLVNPVDDAAMEITHVLRGEDLLSSTPRQIALYEAMVELGFATRVPRFGHLPMVMNEGNKRFSKRDKGSGLTDYMERGFLPEGLLNYLALLGWGIADDRDVFEMAEMIAAFDIRRVNPNAARFDMKKCEAINAAHVRALTPGELGERVQPFLQRRGLLGTTPAADEQRLLAAAIPLIQERVTTLAEAADMLAFLFVDDSDFAVDPADEAQLSGEAGRQVVQAALTGLDGLVSWDTESIESTLRSVLIEGLGLKPRNAFGPVRIAVTGRRVSPPLFESMDLLGRERSLGRLRAALDPH